MLNDFKNVLVAFALVALVFVGGFFSYQRKIEAEDISDSYQIEIQTREEDLESLRQSLVNFQVRMKDLEQQNAGQASEISRLTGQLAIARGQQRVPVPAVPTQVRIPTPAPTQPTVVTPTPKPTPKKVVVSKPSRRSRAS